MAFTFDYTQYTQQLVPLLKELEQLATVSPKQLARLVKKYDKPEGGVFSKDQLIRAYRELAGTNGLQPYSDEVIRKVQMKPMRTQSGIASVTVLTKPFPCPGKCIFCPNDVRMPKSYLSDEPGAQRAERNFFDPYLQTYNRLQALYNIGHATDKIEVIVLGGTWSYYPESYQIWFITRVFEALNDFGSADQRPQVHHMYEQIEAKRKQLQQTEADTYIATNDPKLNKEQLESKQIAGEELSQTYNQVVSELYVGPEMKTGIAEYQTASWDELETVQKKNETAAQRCVGLVIETRPDNISQTEVQRIRRLGCTKTQIGVQSLQDTVLEKNKRGHSVAATRRAFALLRQAGFKIHAHWMANLYGSSVAADKADFSQLFMDADFCPDELKIYPCSLIGSAELMQYYKQKKWTPYSHEELLDVVAYALTHTPEYCRLTRVIRDIPSQDIETGNKLTNFRQIAEQHVQQAGQKSVDIRSREIKQTAYDPQKLQLKELCYATSTSKEYFLQYVVPVAEKSGTLETESEKIVGFLRLSLPTEQSYISELDGSAIIREVHVYGTVAELGESASNAQHLGLGSKLLARAKEIAQQHDFEKLSVISAVGTREYYRKRGFSDGQLYQTMAVSD